MVIEREERSIDVAGSAMRVIVVRPRTPQKTPGLLYATDIFGLTDSAIRSMERFAGYGFTVAGFEMYHRFEAFGRALAFEADRDRALEDSKRVNVRGVDADVAAVVDSLAADPGVDAAHLYATGFCFGGHVAFRTATLPQISRTVCFYATGIHNGDLGGGGDAGSLGRVHEITGELLMIFGSRDPHVPPGGRDAIARALRDGGVRHTITMYDAEHAFMRDEGPRYDPELCDEAFAQAIAFLRRSS